MDKKEELLQQINHVLADSPVIAEDKLAAMMTFCFSLCHHRRMVE
ncbi:hypothetical protein [Xenorhabdus griffiniae]|uniref:Uncharacterized protein n=1 Tax=Xenorhabdus griffiniae TaxID=351672 RepID=A0ABY9XJR0_9GAMM|nr:hypothetical protein [Xenorhabdus griffiniae]WMV73158.1 hypothetical protein QL128_03705 [Xenorhabdus griffiniae]WNH02837.1 hypothetical protein QL112_003710 [Xenorhabdus griffiniae]